MPDSTSPLPPVGHTWIAGRIEIRLHAVCNHSPMPLEEYNGACVKSHLYSSLTTTGRQIAAQPPKLPLMGCQDHRTTCPAQYIYMPGQCV